MIIAGGDLKSYRLFTPGPVDIPEVVLRATAQECIYHREEKFRLLFEEVTAYLKKLLGCSNRIYLLTSSGTGAMEAAAANLLSSTDRVVVAVCGKFGERWLELCRTYGLNPIVIREEYGRSIRPEAIEETLKEGPAVIFTTLTETSTGALNDIKSFGEITRRYDSYLVVDGVAGVGADECYLDDYQIDILVGASQKALMAPPGISFIALSKRAEEKMGKSDLPKYYFNLSLYEKFLPKGQTPFTPAITILYGLKKGLQMILKRGIKDNLLRHKKIGEYVRERVRKMGLDLLPENPSNALTVIKMPPDINSTEIIQKIKEDYGILFANGQGELKGRILRIGHMGNYNIAKLSRAISILKKFLKRRWYE